MQPILSCCRSPNQKLRPLALMTHPPCVCSLDAALLTKTCAAGDKETSEECLLPSQAAADANKGGKNAADGKFSSHYTLKKHARTHIHTHSVKYMR